MAELSWIILFSLLGGVLSVIAASVFLLIPENIKSHLLPHFVSFAIGALLSAAFLALLPHAAVYPGVDFHDLGMTILLGMMAFFLLEKMVLWRHCHSNECEAHTPEHNHQHAAGTLVLVGDAVHNLVDGVLIAAAFLTDFDLGIITAMAVAAHEIPQEVGDFAILLHSGFTRARALLFNVLASLTTVIGAVIAYFALSDMQFILPYVIAVAASSFIYIAVADLIPGLHKKLDFSATLQQLALILAGIITIYLAHSTLH